MKNNSHPSICDKNWNVASDVPTSRLVDIWRRAHSDVTIATFSLCRRIEKGRAGIARPIFSEGVSENVPPKISRIPISEATIAVRPARRMPPIKFAPCLRPYVIFLRLPPGKYGGGRPAAFPFAPDLFPAEGRTSPETFDKCNRVVSRY